MSHSLPTTLAMLVAGFVALAGVPAQASAQPSRRPNVILIMTDDQGYGDVGAHGNKEIKTPDIDRLFAYAGSPVDRPLSDSHRRLAHDSGPFLVAEKYQQPYADVCKEKSHAALRGMITNIDDNVGQPTGANRAIIRVGDVEQRAACDPENETAVVELVIPQAGRVRLQAELVLPNGDHGAALFVEVERLAD